MRCILGYSEVVVQLEVENCGGPSFDLVIGSLFGPATQIHISVRNEFEA